MKHVLSLIESEMEQIVFDRTAIYIMQPGIRFKLD